MVTQSLPSILAVDDTETNLQLISRLLKSKGYPVVVARSGIEALNAVQIELPSIILLDIQMPEMNGYEVCEQLKADSTTANIPVIFISASSNTEDKVNAFKAGGVDYMTKPVKSEEVLARVTTHLKLSELQHELQQANQALASQLEEQRRLNEELQKALSQVKALSGLLPICSSCKKIRDDDGYWHQVEAYIAAHSEAKFSHGMCKDCIKKFYPEHSEDL